MCSSPAELIRRTLDARRCVTAHYGLPKAGMTDSGADSGPSALGFDAFEVIA